MADFKFSWLVVKGDAFTAYSKDMLAAGEGGGGQNMSGKRAGQDCG
jgi:hypothetical protein